MDGFWGEKNILLVSEWCLHLSFLSLKESISDFYWYYSGKDVIDEPGKKNFSKAMTVAKQIFNSLTEYIQVKWETLVGETESSLVTTV